MLTSVDNYTNSYQYNRIGQMTASIGREDMPDQFMSYDVTGKVTEIKDDQGVLQYAYEYDDRGFRILKHDVINSKKTWYIRDASGNIIAIYEQEGTNAKELTELPIYGSSKIGTSFRNNLRHKYNYEVTDHLGNVRAIVSKLKFMETATMEDEYSSKEESVFENMSTRHVSASYNTTPTGGQFTANKVAHLGGTSGSVIGPSVSLKVSAGDKIKMDVNVRYEDSGNNSGGTTGILDLLATSFGISSSGETSTAHSGFSNALGSIPAFGSAGSNVPKAYIQYLLFDNDYNYIPPPSGETSYVPVTIAAMVTTDPNQVAENLFEEISASQDGYIYIYVVNETVQTDVFFDDLTVAQLGVDITQTSDYYPFGSVMSHWQKEDYRFGYQGEFSEEDQETGYNHFEARDYDPMIGRWMVPDPAGQYSSPYLAYGNDPVNRVDPDGRFDKPSNGFQRAWNSFTGRGFLNNAYDLFQGYNDKGAAVSHHVGEDGFNAFVNVFDSDGKAVPFIFNAGNPFGDLDLVSALTNGIDLGPEMVTGYPIGIDLFAIGPAPAIIKSFTSFRALKRYLGGAGKGYAWHHIVEQTKANVVKFGKQSIHSVKNIIRVEHLNITKMHNKISAFYSSKPTFTGGKTVREWLSSQSFKEQYDFGVDILERVYNGKSLPK